MLGLALEVASTAEGEKFREKPYQGRRLSGLSEDDKAYKLDACIPSHTCSENRKKMFPAIKRLVTRLGVKLLKHLNC